MIPAGAGTGARHALVRSGVGSRRLADVEYRERSNVLASNRQNQVMEALVEYAGRFGEATFKGVRINIDSFVEWASGHIGIDEKGIRPVVDGMVKRKILESSALGNSEAILRNVAGSSSRA